MKKIMMGIIFAFFVTLIVGQVCKIYYKDSGIANIKNYEDIYKLNCGMYYIFGYSKEDEESTYNSFADYEEEYVNDYNLAPIAIIARPTGKYSQDADSFGQEIVVEEVLKGSDIQEGNSYYVYNNAGFTIDENDLPVYKSTRNIMNKEYEYLLFLSASDLNEYTTSDSYYLFGSFFSYLNLTDNNSKPVSKSLDMLTYNELKDYEYFASSERIIEQINIIKQKIIDNFIY